MLSLSPRLRAPITDTREHSTCRHKGPNIDRKMLKSWVREEFEVFVLFLKFIISQKHHHAMGNPFAQALHDGGTLENGKKHQALSLQFIDTNCSGNFVVEIAFAQSKDEKSIKLYKIITRLTIAHTGFDTKYIWGSCVADGVAQNFAVLASVEARVCLMHNGYRVGSSTVGEIIWTEMKVAIKPSS